MVAHKDFEKITIVSINGIVSRTQGTLNALIHSGANLPGAKLLLISPTLPNDPPSNLRHVPIVEMGYLEYSVFVLYCLSAFIETEFALIVQDDGWVISASNWNPEFLQYDFTGAPVHLARIYNDQVSRIVNGFEWVHAPPGTRMDNVLNGGFSLRSKRLLQAPRALKLSLEVPPVSELVGPPYSMQFSNQQTLEDVQLCLHMRPKLEQAGIKFAPLELAKQFSFEHLGPRLHDNFEPSSTFGHHSKLRRLSKLNPLELQYQISKGEAGKLYGENRIITSFEKLGYKVAFSDS